MGNCRAIAAAVAAPEECLTSLTSLTIGRVLAGRVSTLIPPCVQVTRYAGRLPASVRSEAGDVETVMLGSLSRLAASCELWGRDKELN